MPRALVDLGPARDVARKLGLSEQLFLARWLQLLYDEAHPRWALRCLSLGNLSDLYPETFSRRTQQLMFAVEDELVRRVAAQEPDVQGMAHPASHTSDYWSRSQCAHCETLLKAQQASFQERLLNLVNQLLRGIEEGNDDVVLALTPSIAAEAVAAGVPPRYMMQTCRNYVLNPRMSANESFRERLAEFLRHDVARLPRESRARPAQKCLIRRELFVKLPSTVWTDRVMKAKNLGTLEVDRSSEQSSPRLWLSHGDVDDFLSRREYAATTLRALTPGWLALLRFCFPDRPIRPSPHIEASSSKTGKIECPSHRRFLSHREVTKALPVLQSLIGDDEVRASLYWLSLALDTWGESVAHAAGMVWMSIESLAGVGEDALALCAKTYVDRVQSQLADDISETLGTLAGDVASRRKGYQPPEWLRGIPWRADAICDEAWLSDLAAHADKIQDPGLRFVVKDAASLANDSARNAAIAQATLDLKLLRAARHAVAHHGKSIAEEAPLHYLGSLGLECIRALLAKRLDRSPFEGALENRPLLQAECAMVEGHYHGFAIPAWVGEGRATYTSSFAWSMRAGGAQAPANPALNRRLHKRRPG